MKNYLNKLAALICALFILLGMCACNNANSPVVDIEDGPGGIVDIGSGTSSPEATPFAGESAPSAETTPDAERTPIPLSENVDPANTIDPNELDGTDEVHEEEKLSYSKYRELNSDVVGWIKIADTNVDYPVVKSHDNIDYLTQNAVKEASKAGAIFMDYRCSSSDKHIIIYGHNMSKSKIMFAQMTNYSNRSFYDAHRTFELKFGDNTYTYKVFAVYSVDVKDAKYTAADRDIPTDELFADYMNNTLGALSIFPVDTTIQPTDQVVTLSTCSHTNYSNGRFVVHAVRVS